MKNIQIIILVLVPFFLFGNMASPYVAGTQPATLSGIKNCSVINETIFIKLQNFEEDESNVKYKIIYYVNSDSNQTIPLVFYGIGMSDFIHLSLNNETTSVKEINKKHFYKLQFSEKDSINVNSEDLVFFNAKLKKGKNKIVVEYLAYLGYNRYGFVKQYSLSYSLYPSKFWKSFGSINIELEADDAIAIYASNIGNPVEKDTKFKWKINQVTTTTIELIITKKISLLSEILLFLHPFGISFLSFIFLFILHYKSINEKYKFKNNNYKFSLSIGNFIIPVLFYVLFFLSYTLIDFSLGQSNSKHGYVFLFIFTLPFFWLFYGLLMLIIDRKLKAKWAVNE